MTRVSLGVVLGLVIGAVDVLLMLPLSFPDKRAALLGAFCARFSLGFFAAVAQLPGSPIVTGLIVGIVTSPFLIALPLFVNRTRQGRAMRATAPYRSGPLRRRPTALPSVL